MIWHPPPFILQARSSNTYHSDALIRICHRGGLAPRIIQEVESTETIFDLVSVGMAASFIAASSDHSPYSGVVLRALVDLTETLTLALVWDEKNISPLVSNLVDAVRAALESPDAKASLRENEDEQPA